MEKVYNLIEPFAILPSKLGMLLGIGVEGTTAAFWLLGMSLTGMQTQSYHFIVIYRDEG